MIALMTLDEVIKYCEEVAEGLEEEAVKGCCDDTEIMNMYYEWAEEHRQLAEWLKELKELREDEDVKDVFNNCDTCKYLKLDSDDYPCDRCMHRYINQYVYDDKSEVEADED